MVLKYVLLHSKHKHGYLKAFVGLEYGSWRRWHVEARVGNERRDSLDSLQYFSDENEIRDEHIPKGQTVQTNVYPTLPQPN